LLQSNAEPVFGPTREGDVRDSQADIEKARRHLNFAPAVAFEDGLRETVAWFQSQHARQ
jgi:UDP-glucose 4-epimerase